MKKVYVFATLGLLGLLLAGCVYLQPLQAKLSAYPVYGPAPLSVVFSPAASTGAISRFKLDFGDGYSFVGDDLRTEIHHTYREVGRYHACLQVFAENGGFATDHVAIEAVQPLFLTLEAKPQTGYAPLEVHFMFEAKAVMGRSVKEYMIDLGDGEKIEETCSTTSFRITFPYVYRKVGKYTVRFSAKDNAGFSISSEIAITVSPRPPRKG